MELLNFINYGYESIHRTLIEKRQEVGKGDTA